MDKLGSRVIGPEGILLPEVMDDVSDDVDVGAGGTLFQINGRGFTTLVGDLNVIEGDGVIHPSIDISPANTSITVAQGIVRHQHIGDAAGIAINAALGPAHKISLHNHIMDIGHIDPEIRGILGGWQINMIIPDHA